VSEAWLLLGVAVALIAGNAVFVAAETALVTVDRAAVEAGAASGSRRLRMVAAAVRTLSTQLSGAQLGITVTSLAIGLVAQPSVAQLLHAPLRALGLSEDASETVAVVLALLAATVVQMVFGELVPKNIALARPESTAVAVIGPLVAFTRIARPLITVLNDAANRLLRVVGVTPVEELRSARTAGELAFVVRRAGSRGALTGATAALLERSLTFGDKTAADVMTARFRLRTVPVDAPVAGVLAATRATGHSRFPVVGVDIDDVVGLVHVKQAVAVPFEDRDTVPVGDMMSPPVLVPTTMRLDPLLDLLQAHGLQLAVVVDEYGGTAGVVTFENLVEELVGDVLDEHDRARSRVRPEPDGSWVVSGLLRPDEVRAEAGIDLPAGHGGYDTVAGLVVTRLHRLPRVGDQVRLPYITLTVERLEGHRVDQVRLTPTDGDAAAGGGPHRTGEGGR
jgi:CBS domain containing-hemolysin-like protein